MQNHEAAKLVTDAMLSVVNTLVSSMKQIDDLTGDGQVSEAEADAYRTLVIGSLDEMLKSALNPIFDIHPDLRPVCGCCGASETAGESCD